MNDSKSAAEYDCFVMSGLPFVVLNTNVPTLFLFKATL